ncbi:MAG: mannitol-phosphate/altronate dehydrogenase, partial [Frankiales bacterium]|nr:mannitol-phosphate/altronate dehydrogenase [Frankiales bacterium]
IRDNLSHGRSFALSATVVASWLRWLEVQSERGLGRQVVDQWWTGQTPAEMLASEDLFGDLAATPAFLDRVHAALEDLREHGPRAALGLAVA